MSNSAPATRERPEDQIRELLDDRVQAVRNRDAARAVAALAPSVLTFDVVNPLQYVGAEATRQRAEQWFSSFEGVIDYEISNLSITAAEDTAFAYGLSHVSGTTTKGERLDMFWRSTLCFRKSDSRWQIVHEHNSVPFDVQTGEASLNLKP